MEIISDKYLIKISENLRFIQSYDIFNITFFQIIISLIKTKIKISQHSFGNM